MKIFIQGSPGSGKNVIAAHLADNFGLVHLNYRSIVIDGLNRKDKNSIKLKKLRINHEPLPPQLAFDILEKYIEANNYQNFVLDGYPKSGAEAKLLSEYIKKEKNSFTFVVETPREVTMNRLSHRLVCPNCSYVLYDYNPSNILEVQCMTCHVPLMRRSDDNNVDIMLRIDRYEKEKEKIVEHMKKVSKVVRIHGSKRLATVINDMVDKIDDDAPKDIAIKGARMLVEGLGLNLADPNIVGTPRRIVKSMRGLMSGLYADSQDQIRKNLSTVFPTHYKGMVILEPIRCVSLCSHHLLPISYEVLFGYIPKDKSLGFSKIGKVINQIAAKPTLQEDFTQEVTDIFESVLQPKGIMVVVRGKHTCMTMRGDRYDNLNITSALRGVFKENQTAREEFLTLAKFN